MTPSRRSRPCAATCLPKRVKAYYWPACSRRPSRLIPRRSSGLNRGSVDLPDRPRRGAGRIRPAFRGHRRPQPGLEIAPDRAEAWLYRANAYRHVNILDLALEDANRAVALSSRSPEALLERADHQILRKDAAGARADLQSIVKLAPNKHPSPGSRQAPESRPGQTRATEDAELIVCVRQGFQTLPTCGGGCERQPAWFGLRCAIGSHPHPVPHRGGGSSLIPPHEPGGYFPGSERHGRLQRRFLGYRDGFASVAGPHHRRHGAAAIASRIIA